MSKIRIGWVLTVLLVGAGTGLAAQELAEMGVELKDAARMLDLEIEEYGKARERERQDLAALTRINAQFDRTIADPNASRDDLVRLERQVDSARESAIESSRACAEQRRLMFDKMRAVAQLIGELEDEGVALTPAAGDLQGTWHLESNNNVTGIMALTPSGSLLTGSFRLSNGRRGSMRGTFAGGEIELQLIDSQEGLIGTIEGELDAATGEISGTWQALELTGNRATAGEWTATRLSAEDVLDR